MTQQGEEEAGEGQSRWRKDRGGRQGTEQRTRKHRLPGGKRGCWVPLFAQRSPLGCGSLDGRGVWGRMDTCVYMGESLHCSSETITVLLIGYTPILKIF